MKSIKWLVSGVGRSGTTLIYSMLKHYLASNAPSSRCIYEPYLWGPKLWDSLSDTNSNSFGVTDRLHPFGIYVHTETELFPDKESHLHYSFINQLFESDKPTLVKIIRGSGRLQQYLDYDDDLRVIHIIRNPLDVVNSALKHFTLFGDEFHRSDRGRFFRSVATRFNALIDNYKEMTEAQQSLYWWKYLNIAAISVAEENDRLMILPYEALKINPNRVSAAISNFLDLPAGAMDSFDIAKPAGPVTREVCLRNRDVEALREEFERYYDQIPNIFARLSQQDLAKLKSETLAKYDSAKAGVFKRHIQTDVMPLATINALEKIKSTVEPVSVVDSGAKPYEVVGMVGDMMSRNKTSYEVLKQALHSKSASFTKDRRCRTDLLRLVCSLQKSRLLKALGPAGNRIRNSIDSIKVEVNRLQPSAPLTCVITSYNNSKYLRSAVESVLAQTRPPQSILIADDCSTDGSQDLIRSLSSEFGNVNAILREQNLGAGLNRHLAYMSVTTPFLTQLDGDDLICPRKFEAELRVLKDDSTAVAYCDFLRASEHGLELESTKAFATAITQKQRVEKMLLRPTPLPHNMVYSKNLYVEAGGYDTVAPLYEDWSLKLRLAKQAKSWRRADVTGLIYNRHGQGLSSAFSERHLFWRHYAISQNFDWLARLVSKKAIIETIRKSAPLIIDPAQKDKYLRAVNTLEANSSGISALQRALSRMAAKSSKATAFSEIVVLIDEFVEDVNAYSENFLDKAADRRRLELMQ